MKASQNIKRINSKTITTFIVSIVVSFVLILLFVIIFHIIQKSTFINMMSYLLNKTVLIFFKNLLIITTIAIIFNYSIVINKTDLLTSTNQNISFSKAISMGLYIIIFLTVIYFIGSEFVVPFSQNRIEWIENNSTLSKFLLAKGNEAFQKKDYKNSLYYYNQYLLILKENDKIERRVREMELKMGVNNFKKTSDDTDTQNNKNDNISSVIRDPFQLAEIYYDKKLFLSAWYYYEYVVEADSSKRKYAREKINEIRTLLLDRNSLNTNIIPAKFLTKKEIEIRSIYKLKKEAEWYEKQQDYQKAFFKYRDILKINPNLRDVIEDKNNAFKKLSDISVELSDAKKTLEYEDSGNLIFFSLPRELIFIKKVIKRMDIFYFYDVTIYKFDENFEVISSIYAPYGVSKSDNSFTLYCYSLSDKKTEFLPIVKDYTTNKTYKSSNYIFQTPISINILQNFTNNYEKTLSYPITDLFKLKNIVLNNRVGMFRNQWNSSFFEKEILQQVNSEEHRVLLSVYKKSLRTNFYIQSEKITKENKRKTVQILNKIFPDFTIGFNYNFIKTAIFDKISAIFLFLSFSLFMMGFAWRYKAGYISLIPKLHIVLFIFIPVASIVIVRIIYSIMIVFYSILVPSLNFNIIMIISSALNIVFLLISIFYLAGTKSS